MAIKSCLTKGEMTKVNKVVDKRKPAMRKDQRLAVKQEDMFAKIIADKDFMRNIEYIHPKNKIRAIQTKFKEAGIKISKEKVDRMLKGEIGIKIPKAKVISKVTPEISKVKGVKFKNVEIQKIYDKHYNEFMANSKLKTTRDFAANIRKEISEDILDILEEWKHTNDTQGPCVLKIKSMRLETGATKWRHYKNNPKWLMKEIHSLEKKIPDKAYLKLRAFNQAYMDKNGIRNLEVYRGVGGRTGVKLKKQLSTLTKKDVIKLKQNSAVSYSANPKIADNFGAGNHGVTFKIKIPASDVIVHDDCWIKIGKWKKEKEVLCVGRELKIPRQNVTATPGKFIEAKTKFIEAKTLAEAKIEWGKYSDGLFPGDSVHIKAWSEKKKLGSMNIINCQMHDMQKWIKGRKLGILTLEDGDSQWNGGIWPRRLMANNSLRLNSRMKFVDPIKREKIYGSLKSGRWTVSGDNAAVTFRHEMGHGMWYDVGTADLRIRGDFTRRYLALDKRIIKRNISEYATENAAEFFAETFSLYSSPEYISGTLNKVFGEGFEELMERILTAGAP